MREVLVVLVPTEGVLGAGILPVKIDAIEAVCTYEAGERQNELDLVVAVASKVRECGRGWAGIVEGPAADRDENFKVTVLSLQIHESLVKLHVARVGRLDFECNRVDSGKGEVNVRVDAQRNILRVELITGPAHGPALVVADDSTRYSRFPRTTRALYTSFAAEFFRRAAKPMLGAAHT